MLIAWRSVGLQALWSVTTWARPASNWASGGFAFTSSFLATWPGIPLAPAGEIGPTSTSVPFLFWGGCVLDPMFASV